ncbi:MAG: hypothetical protein K9M84_13035 [Spirochaetia bacterium]|nr:hypothetical protein [Spirochaetia bacterium]
MSIFEILMLISFGFAWPTSIIRSWRSRSNAGKSLPFLLIIAFGYLSGILHKIIYAPDPVIVLYIINLCMVSADILIYRRNHLIETNALP